MVWRFLLTLDRGVVNYLLGQISIEPVPWLSSSTWALVSAIIYDVWKSCGYLMVIYLAGLQGIAQSYYEAAAIDGANRFQQFRHITLPLISPTAFFGIVISLIGAFQIFDNVWVLTEGGPGDASRVIAMYIYRGRDILFGLFLASLMVPGTVTLIPSFILIRELNLMDSHWALILPSITSAFGVFLLRQHFMSLPQELIDAAKIDGAGYFRIYWQILLPLTGPALSALGIFTFLGAWNNFVGPLLFLRSWENYTFPIAIATLRGYMGSGNQSEVLAGIMISIFPILVVFLVAQRWIVQGAAITGMKG